MPAAPAAAGWISLKRRAGLSRGPWDRSMRTLTGPWSGAGGGNGDPGVTRTRNRSLRRRVLYPVELRGRKAGKSSNRRVFKRGGHHIHSVGAGATRVGHYVSIGMEAGGAKPGSRPCGPFEGRRCEDRLLGRFSVSWKHRNDSSSCNDSFPSREAVSTSLGNASKRACGPAGEGARAARRNQWVHCPMRRKEKLSE